MKKIYIMLAVMLACFLFTFRGFAEDGVALPKEFTAVVDELPSDVTEYLPEEIYSSDVDSAGEGVAKMMSVEYLLGLVSELVGLNISDVYEDRVRVVGKGNKERFVYFGTPCRKAIDAYLLVRKKQVLTDDRALFGSRNGNRISVTAVHRLVDKALLKAGLDTTQFSAHKLRHTAATMMLSGGVDVKTVQEVLGHENLNTTQIYTHIESTELKLAAEANPLSKLDFSDSHTDETK